MADFLTINIKKFNPTVQEALANYQTALEDALFQHAKVLKVVHGYGSHGVGGAIIQEFRRVVRAQQKQKAIKDYINGAEWTLSNPKVFNLVTAVPDCALDEDLGHQNVGITIIVL